MSGLCDYGRRFIGPSLSNRIGGALPKRSASHAKPEPETEGPMRSVEELKKAFCGTADWKDMLDAAGQLGRMVDRLDDLEALGYILRFCQDEEPRKEAMLRLSQRMREIRDARVLEAIVMNCDEDADRRRAIEVLGQRTNDVASSFTLVHIALCSKQKHARFAAVNKLSGKVDELRVISEHSEYDDTKDHARGIMPVPGE